MSGVPPAAPFPELLGGMCQRCSLPWSPVASRRIAARPQPGAELVNVVDGSTSSPVQVDGRRVRRSRTLLFTGLVAVAGLAVAGYILRDGIARPAPIAVSALPFANISNDAAITPFADGLGDEVFNALMRAPGLQTRSRSGARRYRGALSVDAKEVGRRLNVEYAVTGLMREAK